MNTQNTPTPAPESKPEKVASNKGKLRPSGKKTSSELTLKQLLLRCFILLVAPYAYLMLCGLIFDMWLKWYDAVPFIFYSLITFYIVDIVFIVIFVCRYAKARKRR